MWRQTLACCAIIAACQVACRERSQAAENFYVRAFVPTFGGSTSLGANVSTILTLRLWSTLRPRPRPNPDNLHFGIGQIEWSRRTIGDSPDSAVQAAIETKSHIALWGTVENYGPGVIVTSNVAVPGGPDAVPARHTWTLVLEGVGLELGLPNVSYQFSPLILSNAVVALYSRPDQIRVCSTKIAACSGPPLRAPFRAIYLEGDFARVRQPGGSVGWVSLPHLSEAQGEVVDFTAALISYLRGDFEQADLFFSKIRDSKAESLVRNDASLLAGIAGFRRGQGVSALEAAHTQNPYSRYGMQALSMAHIASAIALPRGERRNARVREATRLIESYRHVFEPGDRWLVNADRIVRALQ